MPDVFPEGVNTFDERWLANELPPIPDPDAQPLGQSNTLFLSAKAGRGKTYVLNALLAAARLQGMVALAASFTGLAAQDYTGGMTLHRLFKLPVKLQGIRGNDEELEEPATNVSKSTKRGRLLRSAALFIVDEVPMAGGPLMTAVHELLKDITKPAGGEPSPECFGGKLFVMAGDFQQTAPIVAGGSRKTCVDAWLHQATPWFEYDRDHKINYKTFHRSQRQEDGGDYDNFLQHVGAGSTEVYPVDDQFLKAHDTYTGNFGRSHRAIKLPTSTFAYTHDVHEALLAAHPDLHLPHKCADAAVLCTRNATVDEFNNKALHLKQLQEEGAHYSVQPIQTLNANTKVKTRTGADILDAHVVTDEFLRMCDNPGARCIQFHLLLY
jgi:PIF1-like helicase